jgi:deazaflavin-dependent oxidoreductase (nitroreductase family)
MPLPRSLARFNRRVTNRVTRSFAGHLPGFAIVVHRGRVTGRRYRTPVNAFGRPDGGYVLALTYGADAEWVRNVVDRGGCALEVRGRRVELTNPRIVRDPARRPVPAPIGAVLSLIGVDSFLELDHKPSPDPEPGRP